MAATQTPGSVDAKQSTSSTLDSTPNTIVPTSTPNNIFPISTPNSAKVPDENSAPIYPMDHHNYSLPKSVVKSFDPRLIPKHTEWVIVSNSDVMMQLESTSESETESQPVRPSPGHSRPTSISATPSSLGRSGVADTKSSTPIRSGKHTREDDDKSETSS